MLSGKLDFLMKLTDTSNSALGRALGFDASYISRIRSGKRGLPRDRFFLEPAAAFFAGQLQEHPLWKTAAAEAVCPERGWPEKPAEAEKLLLAWFRQNERQDSERVERLLNGLAAARLLWPEAKLPPASADAADASFYDGAAGKREAVMRLIDDYSADDAPTELLLYTDEKMDWLTADDAYARRWTEGLLRFIERGVRIRIIHTVSRDPMELLDGLRKWMPLYLTSAVEPWYYPGVRDGVFRRTLFIARGFGAITATAVGAGDGLNLLVRERAAVEALTVEFEDYFALCRPLTRIFRAEDRRELWELLRDFEAEKRSRIVAQRLPLGCTLPEEVTAAFERRYGAQMSGVLREAAGLLKEQLDAGLTVTELLDLPPAEEVRAGRVRQPISDYMGFDFCYTPEELKAHLGQVAALLRKRPNYRVVLTDRIPEGTMLYAKEGLGCIFVRLKDPATVFYVTEPRLASAFWAYLQLSADLGQSREPVIRHIEEYMAKL